MDTQLHSSNQGQLPTGKKVHIETWGCQMNVADSEKMLALLKEDGYSYSNSDIESDLIILNTCHIREKARHKVVSRLGRLRELKKTNPNMRIAVTGCVAQAEGKKLLKEAPVIDVLIGPGKISELPELLKQHRKDELDGLKPAQKISIGFNNADKAREISHKNKDLVPSQTAEGKNEVTRYVNIQQGCNNFCTFCVVPFTRGREISEHPDLIVENVHQMVASGAREITLLGQNVNSYGLDLVESSKLSASKNGPFYDILKRVSEVETLERVRFTTSNPHDFTKPVAELFRTHPKLGKYIHLPVQSGSDTILESMKRKVTVDEYWQRVHWLREAVPDIEISTDIIVGFPGETDEDFEQTYKLVEKLRYSFIFAFKYSVRKGTAAPRFRDQVPEEVKTQRLSRLNRLQDQITEELNQAEIGKTREVLFLYESKKERGVYYGRTPHFRLVRVSSDENVVGATRNVKIEASNKIALVGSLV